MHIPSNSSFDPFQSFAPTFGEGAAAAFDPGEESPRTPLLEAREDLSSDEFMSAEDSPFRAALSGEDREAALSVALGDTRRFLDFGRLAVPQDEGMQDVDAEVSTPPAAAPSGGEEDMAPAAERSCTLPLSAEVLPQPQEGEPQPKMSGLPRPLLIPPMISDGAAERKTFTPARSYPLFRTPSGTIRLALTPRGKKALQEEQTVLYRFRRNGQEQRLIGTSDQPDGRVSAYISDFNHPDASGSQLARDVHEHPEQYNFGIIRSLPRDEDPKEAETEAIVAQDSIARGYNQRKGGGGGRARPSQACSLTRSEIVVLIRKMYRSPEKHSLTRSATGRFTSSFVPRDQRKIRNVVYEYLFDPTGSKGDRTHDVGYTTTKLEARVWAHTTYLNDPESKGSRTIPLYNEVRRNPDIVSFRVFDVEALTRRGIPVWELEGAFMQYFLERGEQVLNAGAGGKGSVAHDYVAPEVPN